MIVGMARYLVPCMEWRLPTCSPTKALVFAGCLFEGKKAEAWLNKGFAIATETFFPRIHPDEKNQKCPDQDGHAPRCKWGCAVRPV